MYIPRRRTLKKKCNFTTYQSSAEPITTLIDSGATENFINYRTVMKYRLGTQKLPQEWKILNVDGTENRAGLIKHCVHLYIKCGNQQKRTKFFVTNLGKEQAILGYPWLEEFNPAINWGEGKLTGTSVHLKTPNAVAREQLNNHIRQMEVEEIRKTTVAQQMAEKHLKASNKAKTIIPDEYQIHAKVFSEKEAERFPPSREWDHRIPLKKDTPDTINAKLFSLPQKNRDAIQTWVQKMLDKDFIQRSDSKYRHSMFTVPKKDGTFRIVQDFRSVNKYTEKDVTLLPSIHEAIEGLGNKTLFSKYNIREGYNNIQIVPEDRWKAAFKTHMGLFEPKVMLFGLQGAPGTFSRMIAVNVAPMYREFPADRFKHYMDNCLIATGNGELMLHRQMNHRLLQIFEEHSYFLKLSKCVFEQPEVDFLGIRLGHGEISIDPSKIARIKDWPTVLKSVKEVRSTLGVLGFQRPFIPGFATIAKPLTNLLKK